MKKCFVLLIIFSCVTAQARSYYVGPKGSDKNQGSSQLRPFKTLKRASRALKPGDKCFLLKGVYRETLKLKTSGKAGKPILIAPYRGAEVVISGADEITDWKAEKDGIYSAPMDWNLYYGNQVFINGRMTCEARWPNAGEEFLFKPVRAKASGGSKTTISCPQIPGGKDAWKGAKIWCAGGVGWISWSANITAYNNETHTLTFDKEQTRHWYTPKKETHLYCTVCAVRWMRQVNGTTTVRTKNCFLFRQRTPI